jgi:hypothetical protein
MISAALNFFLFALESLNRILYPYFFLLIIILLIKGKGPRCSEGVFDSPKIKARERQSYPLGWQNRKSPVTSLLWHYAEVMPCQGGVAPVSSGTGRLVTPGNTEPHQRHSSLTKGTGSARQGPNWGEVVQVAPKA